MSSAKAGSKSHSASHSDASALPKEELRKRRAAVLERLPRELANGVDLGMDETALADHRRQVAEVCTIVGGDLPEEVRAQLLQDVNNEVFGFGPIQPLLDDPTVSEVMVNRANRVYCERKGRAGITDITFDDDAHVRRVIDRILIPLGKRVDADNPIADARLPDGSRVNAVISPVAVAGSCLTIRKFSKSQMGLADLVKLGSMTPQIAEFLSACVVARINLVVSGGTSSGKTTLLNALSGCIPVHERVVVIEDAAELKLMQDHVITLEAKPPRPGGAGAVSIRDLVRNALRMRPERIVVGECRGGEAMDMLQAMNTGHDGSMTTLHANAPRDAVSRIETMCMMASLDLPLRAVREQIGSAIQLVVHQSRLRDGSRRVTHVTEIVGMEGDRVILQEIFVFKEHLPAEDGIVRGSLQPGGLRPSFMKKIEHVGIHLPNDLFVPEKTQRDPSRTAAA